MTFICTKWSIANGIISVNNTYNSIIKLTIICFSCKSGGNKCFALGAFHDIHLTLSLDAATYSAKAPLANDPSYISPHHLCPYMYPLLVSLPFQLVRIDYVFPSAHSLHSNISLNLHSQSLQQEVLLVHEHLLVIQNDLYPF